MDKQQIMGKAAAYCATAERCKSDVLKKLNDWNGDCYAEDVLEFLQKQGFIDENRYAAAFARDKIRLQMWGRLKVRYALRQKKISEDVIDQALHDAMPDDEYSDILKKLLQAKYNSLKKYEEPKRLAKTKVFAMSRGFEPYLVDKCLKETKL